jgi:hypothetical protein
MLWEGSETTRDLRGASANAIVNNLQLIHPSLMKDGKRQFKTLVVRRNLAKLYLCPRMAVFSFPSRLKSEFLQRIALVATRFYHESYFS